MELTLALPHSAEQRQGWPPPGSWQNSTGRDSQARQSSGAACCVRALNACTRVRERGKGVRGCPRTEQALPEGVLSPRARRTSFEGA
jgi:hypothetical protein